jgi:CDP-paratose 2-epimerase
MKLLITGICGFAGSTLARALLQHRPNLSIWGIDNLSRPGSQTNLDPLRSLGCHILIQDLRHPNALDSLPPVDWVIDAAAEPSVLAGSNQARVTSQELLDINLVASIPLLEFCRKHHAVFTLLSTSRVYSIDALCQIPLQRRGDAFAPSPTAGCPNLSNGIPEDFSQNPPLSLYGTSKRCAELLALEYGASFEFPVWINRCGVLAGPGQFGKADQGIFSFWIHRWARRLPLQYIGFGGEGLQVRDCLHPADLTPLLLQQAGAGLAPEKPKILNLAGGPENACSLRELSHWCSHRFGEHLPEASPDQRPFDIPWLVLDPGLAERTWGWKPLTPRDALLEDIAQHAEQNPHWLSLCESAPN